MVRMSMSWSIAAGRSALASSRRCCPILIATARAPMLSGSAAPANPAPCRGRGIQHQRGGIGRRQPVVEPVHPEIRDRGHVDHQLRDHHQRDGQQQQLAGQAEPARRPAAVGCLGPDRLVCRSVLPTQATLTLICASDSEDAFRLPERSNYRSLMSAVPMYARGIATPLLTLKTPRNQIYSPQLRRFKERALRQAPEH